MMQCSVLCLPSVAVWTCPSAVPIAHEAYYRQPLLAVYHISTPISILDTSHSCFSLPNMTNIHLLVLIHGMWGNPAHIAELDRIARETHSDASSDGVVLRVLKAESIRDNSTYDGVDWGGERVAKEVCLAVTVRLEKA